MTSTDKTLKTEEPPKKRKPRKPWKKPHGKPKRPLSAYNLFFHVEREKMLAAKGNKSLCFEGMTKTVAKRWNNLDIDEHCPFIASAKVEKEIYENAVKAWKEKTNNKTTKLSNDPRKMSLGTVAYNNFVRPPIRTAGNLECRDSGKYLHQSRQCFFEEGSLPCQSFAPQFYHGVSMQSGPWPPQPFQQDNIPSCCMTRGTVDKMTQPIRGMENTINASSSHVGDQNIDDGLDIFSDPDFIDEFLSFNW